MSALEIRPAVDDEVAAFLRTTEAAFSAQPTDDTLALETALFEPDRSLGVFDAGMLVATAGSRSLELTLPGPVVVPAAGVSYVGVLPTHRRRGTLRALMETQLKDLSDRGEALAMLFASESAIYGRFGYGIATTYQSVQIARHRAAFAQPGAAVATAQPAATAAAAEGRLRLLDPTAAAKVLPAVHDRSRRDQPGDIARPRAWWDWFFQDPEHQRGGAGPRLYVVHEAANGEADGYATYQVAADWSAPNAPAELRVREVVTSGPGAPTAHAALWRYLLDVDLVTTIKAWHHPADDPLRWRLAEPRALEVTWQSDDLWARPVSVPRALAARRYSGSGELVLDVTDPVLGAANTGRWWLRAGGDGRATGERVTADADLGLGVAELGSLLLGGVRASTLARAGRLAELRPGALSIADALFSTDPLPFCRTEF